MLQEEYRRYCASLKNASKEPKRNNQSALFSMIKKTCRLLKNLGGVVYYIKEEVISVAPFPHLWVKFLWWCPPCLLWLVETLKKYCSLVYESTTSNRPGDTHCLCSGLRAKHIKLSHPSHLPFHISSHSVSHMLLNDPGALCTAYTANTP